jgi:hypothetical protein
MRRLDNAIGAVLDVRAGEFDDTFKLTNIPRPVMALELGERSAIEGGGGVATIGCGAAKDGAGDQRDVLQACAKWRDENFYGRDEAVEFAVELARASECAEVATGGEDHARTLRADAGTGESLKGLAQLDLLGVG